MAIRKGGPGGQVENCRPARFKYIPYNCLERWAARKCWMNYLILRGAQQGFTKEHIFISKITDNLVEVTVRPNNRKFLEVD